MSVIIKASISFDLISLSTLIRLKFWRRLVMCSIDNQYAFTHRILAIIVLVK